MLVWSPKGSGGPRATLGWGLSPRRSGDRVPCPHMPCPCVACPPRCKQGPPPLTLLFPLCLPRSLRTQQPPPRVVAYPRPSPSSPFGHQALSDLQAQRDVTAQPLPQLQHGESPGAGGHRPPDPPPLQWSLFYTAPLLEPRQIISALITGVFGCWMTVQRAHPALSSEWFLPSRRPHTPELKSWFVLTEINWILLLESIVIK